MPGRVLEEQRRPAGAQHPIRNLRHFQPRRYLGGYALELARAFELRKEPAQVGVTHSLIYLFGDIKRSQTASEISSSPELRPRTG